LVWHQPKSGDKNVLRLALFAIDRLRPIEDVTSRIAQLGPSQRLATNSEPESVFEIATHLADGAHTLSVPAQFQGLGEILMLAPSTAEGRRHDHFREMSECLWILNTDTGSLSVIPQDWFNEGSYDFGYQWITRVARMPGSSEIVGEGIRLGVFALDPSNRRIAEWLATDMFYRGEPKSSGSIGPES
jgi:hypothetical protein